MATLNLQKKKMMSESNYKRLVNILVGLMASQSTIESQCLFPYDETKTYSKNMICLYQNHLYLCKAATTGVFNPNSWEMQDDVINELSLDEVKNFLSLTPEQLTTLSSIIKDDSIELSKTWSSSKSYMEIDNALKEAKQYCLTQLASKSTGSFKIATSEAEVVDGNYLYLIMNAATSKYDIYALVDGGIEKLTTVDIDLSQYFTKTEISDNYYDKTTSDGKFATITTVDNHITNSTIHITQDEKDSYVKKTNIATTISGTPSDEKVASEKAVSDIIPFKFGIDDNGNYGYYKAGADTVTPFRVEPTQFATGVIANQSSESITIDISKRYLVSTSLKYTEPNDTLRLNNFYVSDGIVQELIPSSIGYGACTLSDNTLTIKNTNTSPAVSLYLCYTILEI